MVTFLYMMMTFFYVRVLFVFQIGIIPDRFHEYLQHRVQMRYEYEKYKKEERKYPYRYDL